MPTSHSKLTTRASVEAMKEQVVADLRIVADRIDKSAQIREQLGGDASRSKVEGEAMASLETFVAVALRVLADTNPSKIKAAMMTVEIQARMSGKRVFE